MALAVPHELDGVPVALALVGLSLIHISPHMVEEMWENMGFAAKYDKMAMQMEWPAHDESKTVDSHVEMAVQMCIRDRQQLDAAPGEKGGVDGAVAVKNPVGRHGNGHRRGAPLILSDVRLLYHRIGGVTRGWCFCSG